MNEGVLPEFTVLRAAASVATPRPALSSAADIGHEGTPAPREHRSVYWSGSKQRHETPVFRRRDLPVGFRIVGPAIVEEYSSTTILPEGDQLVVGELGELQIFIQKSTQGDE